MSILQVKGLKKQFGGVPILKGIDLELEKGQVLSIIGSSGSGKTTLLRCLNFLETPNEGQLYVNGTPLWGSDCKLNDQQKRLHFGLVFQNFNLFPQYTALRNITLAMDLVSKQQMGKAFGRTQKQENEQKARELLERVGLGDRCSNYPCQLSGGQQQRVAIARALALNPDILCFDEPTSALDPELTGEVLEVLRSLKDNNTTMIVVTHEMQFARMISDQVIFMADGKVEEVGTSEQVFDAPQSEKTQAFLQKSLECPF